MPLLIPDECLPWIGLHRNMKTTTEYEQSLYRDFEGMKSALPEGIESILDIGCGLAGIDILLSKHYPHAEIYLLDADGPESNCRPGFWPTMRPYTSREVANSLLKANGITKQVWHDIGTQDLKADLVISLLSLGFHYPLDAYRVTSKFMLADLRKTQKGTILMEHRKNKGWRCIWETA